ncbi:MAG: SLC13 family permease [Prevotellaceae bacterium]|nr:SLC13 family permease [Prevotellaceae bacterium]
MTLIIITIVLIGYVLIATSSMTKINKAAAAIFVGTVGWVLYVSYGTDFVMSQHAEEYAYFLNGTHPTSLSAKQYISQNIFLKHVGKGAEIVLFLLATMSIVEILNNNGCFDFFKQLMRTRQSKKLLWIMSSLTFLLSANLDNLTTTVMMLVLMREIIPSRSQRMIYGSAIVLAANCGGALTVIGDPVGLLLWNCGAVTATNFSASLAIPCLVSWLLPTWWISKGLPRGIDSQWTSMPYRGDETNLKVWQRFVMLIVGIGGLWFIPSFRAITELSPFLGALCVLSVLWIVNEIFNRKLMNVDQMIQRRTPRVMQYGIIQLMLFVMGIMLAVGVAQETGAVDWVVHLCNEYIYNVWVWGAVAATTSSVLDTFATSSSFIALYPDLPPNDIYWKIVAYSSAMGGNILLLGSTSGLALIKMERIHVGWFFKKTGVATIVSWLMGMLSLWLIG